MGSQTMRVEPVQPWHEREMRYHLGVGKGERARLDHTTPVQCLRSSHMAGYTEKRNLKDAQQGCAIGLLRAPRAWPEVPSPRPEPPKSSRRSAGNSVCVFTPAVRVSESFILTADCIKIPVVIGSGAVFSMRILNQAFCPRPERSASEYKDAGDGINRRIFPPLNWSPTPNGPALYLLPNKLGLLPLLQLEAREERFLWAEGRQAGSVGWQSQVTLDCPNSVPRQSPQH